MSGYIILTKTGIVLRRKENNHIKKEAAENYGLFHETNRANRGRMAQIP